jgi:hypothetical protein
VQVLFATVESHVNTVADAILSETGMQRLVDVANQMNNESERHPLLVARCAW